MYESFLSELYKYVTGSENYNNNIIKKHNKNLEKLGEFSFSFDTPKLCTINIQHGKFEKSDLVDESRLWQLQISKCVILDEVCHIFIDKLSTYTAALQQISTEGDKYGCHGFDFVERILLKCDFKEDDTASLNVTQLRTFLAKEVCLRLLKFSNIQVKGEKRDTAITFSVRQNKDLKTLLCGPVLSGTKGTTVSADEFYKNRTTHMRLMAEHKYGVRVTSNVGWEGFFEKLGHAAVTFDLLQNKIHRSVTVTLNDTNSSSSKGASFILYNCARLVQLFKEYDKKISNNFYPNCPTLDALNFNLLKEPLYGLHTLGIVLSWYVDNVGSLSKKFYEVIEKVNNFVHSFTILISGFIYMFYTLFIILTDISDLIILDPCWFHAIVLLAFKIKTVLHPCLMSEEWELLFLYVLQFPNVVKMCIKDILECKLNLNLLCNFLSSMCSTLSVYYRRVRILIEPRDHLIETLHCRMVLLKAVQQVLHNGLYLLNIEPVKLM